MSHVLKTTEQSFWFVWDGGRFQNFRCFLCASLHFLSLLLQLHRVRNKILFLEVDCLWQKVNKTCKDLMYLWELCMIHLFRHRRLLHKIHQWQTSETRSRWHSLVSIPAYLHFSSLSLPCLPSHSLHHWLPVSAQPRWIFNSQSSKFTPWLSF